MVRPNRWLIGMAILSSLFFPGCGSRLKLAPVEGRVTLDGQPVPDAVVTFTPEVPPKGWTAAASTGRTDAQGRYTLALVTDGRAGAVVGPHNVTITINVESESDVSTEAELARQNEVPTNYFKYEVKPGKNTADFSLSRTPTPPSS